MFQKNLLCVFKMPFVWSIIPILCINGFAAHIRHAVIMVMDGARYNEETWGTVNHANIPKIDSLAKFGAVLTQFRTKTNSGTSPFAETNPGHARLTTGTIQDILNDGTQLPTQPGIFQQYRRQTSKDSLSGWVITSKDKLVVLSNSSATGWNNVYRPALNCGVSGTGSGGYREDSVTHLIVKQKLTANHPALMIINYKGPDAMAHAGNFNGYIAAIKEIDGYVLDVWKTIQGDPVLKDSTLLFVLNDHGRHTTDYTSHGDACEGCTHIMCLVLGPYLKQNFSSATARQQIDVAPTIAKLMGFAMPTSTGQYMSELFDTTQTTGNIVKGKSVGIPEKDNHLNVSFNPSKQWLSISYKISSRDLVTMKIFDIRGKEIETRIDNEMYPGSHIMQWNTKRMSGGAYYCYLKHGNSCETKKVAMIK